jgi:hypothetical protein
MPAPATEPKSNLSSQEATNTESMTVPQPAARIQSRTARYLVVVVVAIAVVLVLSLLAASGVFSPKATSATTASPEVVAVAPSGTAWTITEGSSAHVGPINLTSKSAWIVSGMFTATLGVSAFVLTEEDFLDWGGAGSPPNFVWTSGPDVTSQTYNFTLSSNTYYFVWINVNSSPSASVKITAEVRATYAAPFIVTSVQFTILQGANSSGLPWFGPNFTYSGSVNNYPFSVAPGANFTLPVLLYNYDNVNHTVYSMSPSSPFTFVKSTPAFPWIVQPVDRSDDSGTFDLVMQAPRIPGDTLTLFITINALPAS